MTDEEPQTTVYEGRIEITTEGWKGWLNWPVRASIAAYAFLGRSTLGRFVRVFTFLANALLWILLSVVEFLQKDSHGVFFGLGPDWLGTTVLLLAVWVCWHIALLAPVFLQDALDDEDEDTEAGTA